MFKIHKWITIYTCPTKNDPVWVYLCQSLRDCDGCLSLCVILWCHHLTVDIQLVSVLGSVGFDDQGSGRAPYCWDYIVQNVIIPLGLNIDNTRAALGTFLCLTARVIRSYHLKLINIHKSKLKLVTTMNGEAYKSNNAHLSNRLITLMS